MRASEREVLWFTEVGKKDIPLVGGKGANLGEMTQAQIPLPPGFIVTAHTYSRFLEQSGLRPSIEKFLCSSGRRHHAVTLPLAQSRSQVTARHATSLHGTTPEALEMVSRSRPATPVTQRRVGQFWSEWKQRIFVGGPYRNIAILNEIKRIVDANGFDPILPVEFETPEGHEHQHSLMLLHECSAAIFDLSVEAGQLMEIDHIREYGITEVLFIYQGRADEESKMSKMLSGFLERMEVRPERYDSIDTLNVLVEGFLARLQRRVH